MGQASVPPPAQAGTPAPPTPAISSQSGVGIGIGIGKRGGEVSMSARPLPAAWANAPVSGPPEPHLRREGRIVIGSRQTP